MKYRAIIHAWAEQRLGKNSVWWRWVGQLDGKEWRLEEGGQLGGWSSNVGLQGNLGVRLGQWWWQWQCEWRGRKMSEVFPRKYWQTMVTSSCLGVGKKREDESRMTSGFRPLWLGGRSHLHWGRGLEEEAALGWGFWTPFRTWWVGVCLGYWAKNA